MKAEAILRGGSATLGQTAPSLVNMIKANRTTSPPLAAVSLADVYIEDAGSLPGKHSIEMT